MKTYEIHEDGNGKFATIEARTAQAALNKAAKKFPRRAKDYNGYVGPVVWRAFLANGVYPEADITLQVSE